MECKFKNKSKQKKGSKCQQIQSRNNQHMGLIGNFWSFYENMCNRRKKNFKNKKFINPYVRIIPINAGKVT